MSAKIKVEVDEELEDLIPEFLEGRQKDIDLIRANLVNEDFENIKILGHSMKGSGGGYGFDEISRIGKEIESAAQAEDAEKIRASTEELRQYLGNIEVTFV